MTENTAKMIKIVSGIAVVVIAGAKFIKAKTEKTEEPENEEATQ